MANKKITDVTSVSSMLDSDNLFIVQGGDIKQIVFSNAFTCNLHNIPRRSPKDITSYYNDGTLWKL